MVIVPITLGRGVSLWEGSIGAEDRFTIESVMSPSGLTHQLWNKNDHVWVRKPRVHLGIAYGQPSEPRSPSGDESRCRLPS